MKEMSKKKKEIQCWACGELGHVRNHCKNKDKKSATHVSKN